MDIQLSCEWNVSHFYDFLLPTLPIKQQGANRDFGVRAGIYYSKWGEVPTSDNEPGDFLIFLFVFVFVCRNVFVFPATRIWWVLLLLLLLCHIITYTFWNTKTYVQNLSTMLLHSHNNVVLTLQNADWSELQT